VGTRAAGSSAGWEKLQRGPGRESRLRLELGTSLSGIEEYFFLFRTFNL
jgi:hypothetical protein